MFSISYPCNSKGIAEASEPLCKPSQDQVNAKTGNKRQVMPMGHLLVCLVGVPKLNRMIQHQSCPWNRLFLQSFLVPLSLSSPISNLSGNLSGLSPQWSKQWPLLTAHTATTLGQLMVVFVPGTAVSALTSRFCGFSSFLQYLHTGLTAVSRICHTWLFLK